MLAMVPCEQKPATKQVLNSRVAAIVKDIVSVAATSPVALPRSDIDIRYLSDICHKTNIGLH